MPSRAKSHRGQIEDKEAERDNEELIEAMNSKLLLSKPMEMMSSVSGKLTAIIMALLLVNEYRRWSNKFRHNPGWIYCPIIGNQP